MLWRPPAPPPPPQFPAESFEPTLISPPRKPPTPAPAPAAAMPPVPKTQDGKPDIAAIAFDAGVTVSPAAIGGLQKVHPPGAPAPAGGMPQTIPDRAPAPPPVPAGHAQPSAHTPQGQPAVTADQLLVPLHNRPKTQPMPPPVPAQPQAPAVQPLQPQQPAVPQPAPAARGGVAAPVFTQAAKDGWGEMTPPEAPTDDERQWGMLSSLLSLFCLIGAILGFIVKGQSKFVKFYCLQMLFLFVVTFAVNIVFTIAFFILAWIVPFLIFGMHLMSLLMMLAYLGAVVIQALKANQGMIFKLPLIGSFAYKLAYGK